MILLLRYLIPYSYAQRTRFNSKKDFFFHFYYEWGIAFLILLYNFRNWEQAFLYFVAGFIAYTCIYELGYLFNDIYATKFDTKPRNRIKGFKPKLWQITIWVVLRGIIFIAITYLLDLLNSVEWWLFYLFLIIVFGAHNLLRNKQLKIITFVNLAFFRILAPFFIFIDAESLSSLIPALILNYVFFRTITYMDSKGLLHLPDRKTNYFKLFFYLMLLPVAIMFNLFFNSYIPLAINIYYLIFWLFYFIFDKVAIQKRL